MKRFSIPAVLRRFSRWRRRRVVAGTITAAIVILAPVLAVATFVTFGSIDPSDQPQMMRAVLLADLVYVLVVATLVARQVGRMVSARRRKSAGSKLHLRLTGVFAVLALVPTVLVAVFATVTLNLGLEGWFSDRVRQVVGNSLEAAEAYKREHRENLMFDARLLANYLDQQKERFPLISVGLLRELLDRGQQNMQREVPEAYIIDSAGELIARGDRSYLFDYERPSNEEIARALQGDAVLIEDYSNNEFRALIALFSFPDRLLYVTRDVDGDVLTLLDETQETVGLYQQLERDRGRLLFEFALIYLGFAVFLILAAVWLGLWFAERLATPIGRLAGAAQRVGSGDLDVQVIEESGDDEIATLGQVFNRMTRQVKAQRDALVESNLNTERRRRLFDSVLSGVTAGVIGLSHDGKVEILNRSARNMLDISDDGYFGKQVEEVVPEFEDLVATLMETGESVRQREVQLIRQGIYENLLVRAAARRGAENEIEGYVITFDDVTDLVSAQRMAAWGDVARRIAHEIKNPLTPIRLSAERLRRKYGEALGESRQSFEQYTDVIIRQTNDLRRIVDEFSKFARMPKPERSEVDILELIRDAVLLRESADANVEYRVNIPSGKAIAIIDPTMIGQALTNILKNASEAIEDKQSIDPDHKGIVAVSVDISDRTIHISIADNGVGLPENRARLFEPYVTSRDKGTGLGLPIVKKIIEEHQGGFELLDAKALSEGASRGAEARITLELASEYSPDVVAAQ